VKPILLIPLALTFAATLPAEDVLIVADEIPAMEVLAKQFQNRTGKTSRIVKQTDLPASLTPFKTVAVYIHKDIDAGPEHAFLDYLNGGGKLLLLHHSISSGKRKNKDWLPAFQITLPITPFENGGYKYFDPVTFDVVNLAPGSAITTSNVHYTKKVSYQGRELDAFTVANSEIYLNHQFDGPRTKLLGIKWTDPKSGKTYEQDTGGWYKKVGKGEVYYFMVGHNAADFDNDPYAQILANVLEAK